MGLVNTDSLKISTKHFYHKPVQAFYRALELEEYLKTRVKLKPPVMDLGCGDGTFGSMLHKSGIVYSIQVSLDLFFKDIMEGKKKHKLQGGIQGDIRKLPLKSGSVSSIFSNGVLCCLRSEADIDYCITEVYRALQEQGLFVVSVPTPHFDDNLLVPKILTKAGMSKIARNYLFGLRRRLTHENMFHEAEWEKKLKVAGFSIEHVRYYFTRRPAYWWNILSFHFFRVFSILQILGPGSARHLISLQEMIFRPVFEKEQSIPQAQKRDEAGYLLFVARK